MYWLMSDDSDRPPDFGDQFSRRSVLRSAGATGFGIFLAGQGTRAATTSENSTVTEQTADSTATMTGPLNLVTDVEQDFENGSIPETFNAVSVIPPGSRVKYEYRQDIPGVILDRMLHSEVRYPGGYGFIPQTNAGDGDPLDVLIMLEEPLIPGTVLDVRPVAVLQMTDDGENDDKIVAAPVDEPRLDHITEQEDIPQHQQDIIAEFFKTYKNLEDDPNVVVDGFGSRSQAYDIVETGATQFSADTES